MARSSGYVKGYLNRIGLIGGKVVKNEKDAKLNISASYDAIMNKDDIAPRKILSEVTYSVTFGQDIKFDTDATRTTYPQLIASILAGMEIPIVWAIHTTASTPAPNAGDDVLTGAIVFTGIDTTANIKGQMMADHTAEGSGPIVLSVAV
jgi:hypothetical protein